MDYCGIDVATKSSYVYVTDGEGMKLTSGEVETEKEALRKSLKPYVRGGLKIAIPGRYTTANFLLGLAFPRATDKSELVFSEIENAVLTGSFDAGLIIHENRFTYEAKGLKKIVDLGEFWEATTLLPIPLGGIVMKRSLPADAIQAMNRVLRRSVEFAFADRAASLPYVRAHAQEMSEEVMYKHIDLYVNEFSVDLGQVGRHAVETLLSKAQALGLVPPIRNELFLRPTRSA